MKFNAAVTNFLTNKMVLNVVSFIALLNVIGYAVMGKFNNVLFFIVLVILVKYFSKNMIIILGVPLLVVNLLSLRSGSVFEGLENNTDSKAKSDNQKNLDKALDDKKKQTSPMLPGTEQQDDKSGVVSANVKTDESFEVGRKKNAASKIDYATTVEDAYDELNKILGSDGIKRLTSDTQGLMQQQADLAKSMEAAVRYQSERAIDLISEAIAPFFPCPDIPKIPEPKIFITTYNSSFRICVFLQ